MNLPEIGVRKAKEWPTWLVRIGPDILEMDADANAPNGVNMYFGDHRDPETRAHFYGGAEVDAPHGIVVAIAREVMYRAQGVSVLQLCEDGKM